MSDPLVVLVAEDNPVNALVVTRMLALLGHQVEHVTDGAMAVERCRDRRYDVIIVDLSMPKLDGIEATKRIRALERESGRRRTPVLAVTAHFSDSVRADCAAAGIDECVGKPFSRAELEQAIARHRTGPSVATA